jgi:hypothetical protein
MTERADGVSWRDVVTTALVVFLIAFAGCVATFGFWLQDLSAPQVAFLGSGNQLSLLVSDGPARLLLATGDSPIDYQNALTQVRPIFARRVDVLLLAGSGSTLLVPQTAASDAHVRIATALAPLPESPEAEALGPVSVFSTPRRIRLGPSVQVTVETALPFGMDPDEEFPAWRVTVERGETRIVVLSDGGAAALFPPDAGASVLAVSGDDPAAAWELSRGVAFVANAEAIGGPEMRSAATESRRPPEWGFRVFPGEALRLRFVPGGVELPSEPAQNLADWAPVTGVKPNQPAISRRVRRRASLSRARTRP